MEPIVCVFLIAGYLQINAQKVSFNEGTVSLKEAFQKIEASSKYKIAYNGTQLDVSKRVQLNQKNVEVLDVLKRSWLIQGILIRLKEIMLSFPHLLKMQSIRKKKL